jgi:hypothetical protein
VSFFDLRVTKRFVVVEIAKKERFVAFKIEIFS